MPIINFNVPRPRQFNYHPRYYDERKERLTQMRTRAEAELAAEKRAAAAGYTGNLQKGFLMENRASSKLHRRKLEQRSALRFFIILIALLGILYMIAPDIFMIAFGLSKP